MFKKKEKVAETQEKSPEKKDRHLMQWGYLILDIGLMTVFIMTATLNYVNGFLKNAIMYYLIVLALTVKLYFDIKKIEEVTGYAKKQKAISDKKRNDSSGTNKRKRGIKRNRI